MTDHRATHPADAAQVEHRCPWCGHPDDCQPGVPGESLHHFLCCVDRHNPACLRAERDALDRIMRDEREDREEAS